MSFKTTKRPEKIIQFGEVVKIVEELKEYAKSFKRVPVSISALKV